MCRQALSDPCCSFEPRRGGVIGTGDRVLVSIHAAHMNREVEMSMDTTPVATFEVVQSNSLFQQLSYVRSFFGRTGSSHHS